VDEAAVEFGMTKISNDQAIWILHHLILVAHVDDVLICGDTEHSTGLMKHLASKYKFKDLGPAGLYTGIYIIRDRNHHRLFLDQAPYVSEILEDYNMTNCTPSAIPMDPKATWDQQQDDIPLVGREIKLYQRAIGQLMYLMLATRPDIAYAVTKLAQFAATPTNRHWAGVLKIMRYLRAHTSVRLCLGSTKPPMLVSPPTNLIGYFDASLMDCTKTRKSTGAYTFFLQGSCVSWASKKQGLIALSSTEAEFIAGTEAAKELAWIIEFLEHLAFDEKIKTPHLIGDNQGALAMAKSSDFRPRTKHIHARERYITHMVESGQCQISYVPTKDMIADALTKALPREQHEYLAKLLGLVFGDEEKKTCHQCLVIFSSRNTLHKHLRLANHYCDDSMPSLGKLIFELDMKSGDADGSTEGIQPQLGYADGSEYNTGDTNG